MLAWHARGRGFDPLQLHLFSRKPPLQRYRSILIIGVIEILIGSITLLTTILSLLFSINKKSPSVLFFVIVAGILSLSIGLGVLSFRRLAYQLLLYFSSVVVLSKILLLMGVIQLNGSLFTPQTAGLRNTLSVIYHVFIIFILLKKDVKELFHS